MILGHTKGMIYSDKFMHYDNCAKDRFVTRLRLVTTIVANIQYGCKLSIMIKKINQL